MKLTKRFISIIFRLPVLDTSETVEIIKKYLAEANFTVFEVCFMNQSNVLTSSHLNCGIKYYI